MEQESNQCQICLCVPSSIALAQFESFVATGGLDAVACIVAGASEKEIASALLSAAHSRDIPLLVEADANLALKIGADGVHLPGSESLEDDYKSARATLGDDAIIGVSCEQSRHAALTLAEMGADYIACGSSDDTEAADFIAWWSAVTIVPCVAWNIDDASAASRMAKAGADFVAVSNAIWSSQVEPEKSVAEIADVLGVGKVAA